MKKLLNKIKCVLLWNDRNKIQSCDSEIKRWKSHFMSNGEHVISKQYVFSDTSLYLHVRYSASGISKVSECRT